MRMVSIANFRDWRELSTSFEAMATYRGREYPVTPETRAEYAQVTTVDAEKHLLACSPARLPACNLP